MIINSVRQGNDLERIREFLSLFDAWKRVPHQEEAAQASHNDDQYEDQRVCQ